MLFRRPRVLFAAPRGPLIAALIPCTLASFACTGPGPGAVADDGPVPVDPDRAVSEAKATTRP